MLALEGLSLGDVALLLAVLAYAIKESLDALGWSRSSKILRRENTDLIRRNDELEAAVGRLDGELDTQRAAMKALEEQVSELKKRDQGAVLAALERTHAETKSVLEQILHELQRSGSP